MALTSNERKSLIASVDSAEITLSNGEKPEASVDRDIRYAARQFLKAELAKVSTKAEADELVRGTFALMRSFDASDSAFSREKLRLSHGVQAASRDLRGNIASSTASASTETDETVEIDGLPSLGRINLGGDYSERSIDGSIPDFDQAKKPTLTLANLKDVNGSILGEGVIVRDRSGRRIRSVARGTAVSLTGEVVYMRGVDSAGHSQVLPYVVLAGGKTAVAAKFVAGIASAASAANPAPDKKTDVATSATTTGSASAQPTGTLSQPGATASTAPLPNGRLSDAQSSNPA